MRCDLIIRCVRVIEVLKRKGGVTAAELADEIGINRRTAYRYILAMSIALPVVEHGPRPFRFELIEPMGNIRPAGERTCDQWK